MDNISLPSVFDNPNSSILNQNKQNEEQNENSRMNNEPTSTKTNVQNGIDVNSSMRWSVLQDIEDRKLSLAIVQEKVKKLNSVECMLLYMHLPQYACSDGSVESNFKLQRHTFIKNSFVSLVSDAMKGTINTLSEEIKNLQEDVDIIEQKLFNNAGVVCGNIFKNLNFNNSVQNVIAWCKVNYKQKLDSVVIKSDMHNHYTNDVKTAPLMSSVLFGKLVLIIFPSAAVTRNYKGILQYKNLCKVDNVTQTSEVKMDSIASELSCKQIFDIYDQVINHISRKVSKMDNRQESQQNNVTVTLNNDNENDSYRSGELEGCTVIVHDPLSLLNLSASVQNDNRKKPNNLKVKSANNVTNDQVVTLNSSLDLLATQKLADIIGCRLENENNAEKFQNNLKLFKSKFKEHKFKEYKHPSVKKITTEYPKINLDTNLIKTNLIPDVAISEGEIFDWYVKRFTALKEKLSKMSSSQIPGKGMHKLHCGCCNVNFEVGDGYIRGLDLLRNKLAKLKIVNGPGTRIYVERDPNEIIEIVDEEPATEPTKVNIPQVNNVQINNKIPVITKTETLATSEPPNNVKVTPPSSSKEAFTKPPPTPVPQIPSKSVITFSQVIPPKPKPPITLSQIIIKPPVTLFQSATLPVESPQIVTKKSRQTVTQDVVPPEVVPLIEDIPVPPSPPVASPNLVTESPVEVSQVLNEPLAVMPQSITKPVTVSAKIITKSVTVSSQIVSKPETVYSQIVSKPATVSSQIVSKPATVSSQIVSKPATVSSQIVSKPATVSSQILSKPATVFSQIVSKPATVSSQIVAKPGTLSYRIVTKPTTVPSQIFPKPTIVSSQATTKSSRKSFSLQLKKNSTIQPTIKNSTIQPTIKNSTIQPTIKKTPPANRPILSKASTQANTNVTPVATHPTTTHPTTISNDRSMPKMILLKDLLATQGPPVSNIRLSTLNLSKTPGNKQKYTAKQVDNVNQPSLTKSIRIQKVLEGIPAMSKNITGVTSSVQQHISIQSLYKKYNEIVIPKAVMHSDVAPVVVLNSGEVCDWYLEKMNNLNRLVRKYKKKSQKATSSSTKTTVAVTCAPNDTTVNTTTTSLTLEKNPNTNVLSCRRSKARLMNFCEIDSDGEGDTSSSRSSAILGDLLSQPVSSYVSQVTLKRARTETYDERGNKRRKIFREHRVVSNDDSIDTNLIEISDDIPIPDDDKVYKCTFCLKTFFGIAQLLYHNKTHLYCRTCKKRFRNVDSMLKHLTNHCVVNARKCTPCLKLQRVDAVVNIAEAKTARNNINVVPKHKQAKKTTSVGSKKCNIQSNKALNTIQLQELLNSQSNSILQQMMMSSMLPPKLVPTSSAKTSQAVSLSSNSNAVQQSSSSNANHGSVYFNPSSVPISSQSLSMPLLQPPPLVSTSVSSKSVPISKHQPSYMTNQIQLQPVIQQQQNAQPVQLKNAINNNYNKIFLLNNLQGGNFMCGGQVVINNENAYLVTSGNQSYINNPITSSYNVPTSFNVVPTIASPIVQQLNIQPNGLEDHSYHQQRLPLQDENVDVANTNNAVLQPPGNNTPDGGSFKLRVRSLHELR